jgi:hypothetical protein
MHSERRFDETAATAEFADPDFFSESGPVRDRPIFDTPHTRAYLKWSGGGDPQHARFEYATGGNHERR